MRRGNEGWRGLLLACCALALSACAPMAVQRQAAQIERNAGHEPTVVVMPLDVELSELTAGGVEEPRADWTEAARRNMRGALDEQARSDQVRLMDFDAQRGTPEDQATALALRRLHRAVGVSILTHQYSQPYRLPSKGGKFDWSLGPQAAVLARTHGADYALFVYVRDSYASGGRAAVMVLGALMGVGIAGGVQVGFASLVDLKNGDIVWFNRLARGTGDLRTPPTAAETVKVLVSDSFK